MGYVPITTRINKSSSRGMKVREPELPGLDTAAKQLTEDVQFNDRSAQQEKKEVETTVAGGALNVGFDGEKYSGDDYYKPTGPLGKEFAGTAGQDFLANKQLTDTYGADIKGYEQYKMMKNAQAGNDAFTVTNEGGDVIKPADISDKMIENKKEDDKKTTETIYENTADTEMKSGASNFAQRQQQRKGLMSQRKLKRQKIKLARAKFKAGEINPDTGEKFTRKDIRDAKKKAKLEQAQANVQNMQNTADEISLQTEQGGTGSDSYKRDVNLTENEKKLRKEVKDASDPGGGSSLFKDAKKFNSADFKVNLPSLQDFTKRYLNEKGAVTSKPSGEGSSIPANQNPMDFNKPGADTALFKLRGPMKKKYFQNR